MPTTKMSIFILLVTAGVLFQGAFPLKVISTLFVVVLSFVRLFDTAQKIKFSIKDFFSKCDQIRVKVKFSYQKVLSSFVVKEFLTE